MRLALVFALVLAAAAAPRQGCGNGGSSAYVACDGKTCGDACTVCAPGDPSCTEVAVVKACDPFGRCVPLVDGLCVAATGTCAGKACGDECVIDPPCRSASPPCMLPSIMGYCANDTECVAGPPPPCPSGPPPVTSCASVACGARCQMPCSGTECTSALGWCAGGECVQPAPPCPLPPDPCAGKACGAACDPCGGMCMNPVASACDAAGRCVPVPVTCGP